MERNAARGSVLFPGQGRDSLRKDCVVVTYRVAFTDQTRPFIDSVYEFLVTLSIGVSPELMDSLIKVGVDIPVRLVSFSDPDIPDGKGTVSVALSLDFCQPRLGLAPLLSILMYMSVYGTVDSLEIIDLELPEGFTSCFLGPKFGWQGVEDLFGGRDRPPLGLVLKPRRCADPDHHMTLAYEALVGGFDYIIDDELLTDPQSNPFAVRLEKVGAAVMQAEQDTGRVKAYFPCVTAAPREAKKRILMCRDVPAVRGVSLNTLAIGFDSVSEMSCTAGEYDLLVISALLGNAFLTSGPKFRITEHVLATLCRLSGIDCLYIGPVGGDIRMASFILERAVHGLRRDLCRFKPCGAVASGGMNLNTANVVRNMEAHAGLMMFQMSSTVMSFKGSIRAAAKRISWYFDELSARSYNVAKMDQFLLDETRTNRELLKDLKNLGWEPTKS